MSVVRSNVGLLILSTETDIGRIRVHRILIVGGPIARAVAKRISGHAAAGSAELPELLLHTERRLDETEQRLADTTERLLEMEERLDFTERMHTRQNAREQLGP